MQNVNKHEPRKEHEHRAQRNHEHTARNERETQRRDNEIGQRAVHADYAVSAHLHDQPNENRYDHDRQRNKE